MKQLNRHSLCFILWLISLSSLFGQMIIRAPKNNTAIEKGRIAVTVAGKPGSKTWIYINNVLADSGEIRIDGLYDFLNIPVPEGPVEIRTEAVGAGDRLFKAVRQVHIVGSPDSLAADCDKIELPADSQSVQRVQVTIFDAWGYPVDRIKTATLRTGHGTFEEPDLDSLSSGCQVAVHESRFEFHLRAAGTVGQDNLILRAGEANLIIPVKYTLPLTELILVGSADAAVSAAQFGQKDDAIPEFTLADWTHQEGELGELPVSGRLAFYAKGSLFKKYLMTASYDSRRTRDNQLFRDMDPNQQYALYGDAGTLTYDAQTQSKFYGKIERDNSFVQMGDFNTEFRSTEFAKYDRSFTGLISRLYFGNHQLSSFATLNDRTMKLDEIRGEGISGYYFLTASRITLNSDKIRIETRDRYHPEKVIDSKEMVRYLDYDINFVDGTLMFKQPVPSIDAAGNPVTIIAVYEYQTDAATSLIGGLRYEGSINKFKFGSTLIMEEKKPSNFYMFGTDATIPLTRWMQLKGEYAQTHSANFSQSAQTGHAWLAELDLKPIKAVHLNGYYRKVEDNFLNPSQTGSRFEVGAEKYGTVNTVELGKMGKIRSDFYRQLNDAGTVNEYCVQVANTTYEYTLNKKTTARIGYQDAERKKTGKDTMQVTGYRSKMITGKITRKWSERLSIDLEHEQNLAEGKTTLPTGTSLGLTYELSKKISLFLKQRLLNPDYKRTQTILGIDSKINRSTQVTGKYEIGGAAGEALNRATIGLRNKWEVRKDLTFNLAFESTSTMDSLEVPTTEHNAVSIGLEYLPDQPWKASGKYEIMQDKIVRKQVVTLAGEIKIMHGLSTLARVEYSGARYLKSVREVWNRGNTQLGLAYRPENNDIFNSILKVQWLTDKNTHAAPKTTLNRLILSSHGYWQVSSKASVGLRFALRQLLDEETGFFRSKTTTSLYALRGEYTLRQHWLIGLDLRMVRMSPVHQIQTGAAGELGYCFKPNMVAGAGYIFKQLKDADFSFAEYNYTNLYLVLRIKFDENIFNWR